METNEKNCATQTPEQTKFCKHCGQSIPQEAVLCTHCGRQVEEFAASASPQVIIQNSNMNTNTNVNTAAAPGMRAKNKWTAVLLCAFLGVLGGHKFYEGKTGMGVLYLFTLGLFGMGVVVDFIVLLFKPNPYYV